MIKAEVFEIIKSYPKIALAVSGGSDSMAMLFWFIANCHKDTFMVATVDHRLRGAESAKDCEFVADYCKANGVECRKYEVECVKYSQCNGYTIEQGARKRRQRIFEELCINEVYAVATAHHADDQAESVFMHIARGAGIDGLTGMSVVDGHLIRPLINTSKAEIMEYIQSNNIPFVEDGTNVCDDYTRNFVRNKIMPLVKSKYPNFSNSLVKLARRSREYQEFIDLHTPTLTMERNSVLLDIAKEHKVIAAEMIRRAFALLGVDSDVEERHLDLILELPIKKNNACLDMPYSTRVYNENGKLVLEKLMDYSFNEIKFGEGVYILPDGYLTISRVEKIESFKSGSECEKDLYADGEKLRGAVIRVRRDGDRINKFGNGSKSLGDFLTDKKIALRLRDRIPIIADGSRVYCVAGVDISADCKVDENTSAIYKISYLRD